MFKKQYFLAFSVTALLFKFTSQPALAFSITRSNTGNFTMSDRYAQGNLEVRTSRFNEQTLPKGGTKQFKRILRQSYSINKWKFVEATRDLEGSFKLLQYYPCVPNMLCGAGKNLDVPFWRSGVGGVLELDYQPKPITSDPEIPFIKSDLHWIQLFRSWGPDGYEERIDTLSTFNPYYSSLSTSNPGFFDSSYRPAYQFPHKWIGELYLAQQTGRTAEGQAVITIYNGIRWGWQSSVRRRRDDDFCPAFQIISAAYGGDPGPGPGPNPCPTQENSILPDINEQGWQFFNSVPSPSLESSQTPTTNQSQSVPEPSLNVGLLVFGIWSVRTLSQKKQELRS